MSPELYRQTREALMLNGLSDKSQDAHLRAVRLLLDFHSCTVEQLTEAQLHAYYLHRPNVDHWSPSTLRLSLPSQRWQWEALPARRILVQFRTKAPHQA